MTNYLRVTGKVFGENATTTGDNPGIGQFGSAKTGTKVATGDIATIQALTAWGDGWEGAVMGTRNYPTLPEMTGVMKNFSQQICYVLQKGTAEYDANTTYYQNDFCKVGHEYYYSLTNDNIGNNPTTSPANWQLYSPGLGTYANQDLSNLTTTGEARLHALKGYLDEGELLTDAAGLADVIKYAHSTFDASKFTKVGSPNITNNGIASGFSNSNYLDKTIDISSANSWEIIVPVKFTSTPTGDEGFWGIHYNNDIPTRLSYNASASVLLFYITTTDGAKYISVPNFTFILNTEYLFKSEFTGTEYKLSHSIDNGLNWTTLGTPVSSSAKITGCDDIRIGIYYLSYPLLNAQVNLKQFTITADGVEVLSGNRTGIDTIKPDDYTVVGSPTISDDGVASGLSDSNYLTTTLSNSLTLDKIDIYGSFLSSSATSGSEIILAIASDTQLVNTVLQVALNRSAGQIQIGCHNDTTWSGHNSSSNTINSLTKYYYHVYYKDGYIKLDLSTDGITYNNVINDAITVNSSFTSSKIYIGSIGQSVNYFTGSIDLNAFKIYVVGDLVYQPCLKIPYTESKTGSKIVDYIYRDRVADAYNQGFPQRYYTLSDTDFTLPMGEVYGDIENKLDTVSPKQSEIDTVIGWGEPDYANGILAGISLNTTVSYTAPSKGYIIANLAVFGGTTYVDINNVRVAETTSNASQYLLTMPVCLQVDKGDEIEAFSPYNSTTYAPQTVYFYPCKGV